MNYLHSKSIPHGDIRGHNIFIKHAKEGKGIYKLVDLTITGKRNQQYQEFIKGVQKICTLAPEEL